MHIHTKAALYCVATADDGRCSLASSSKRETNAVTLLLKFGALHQVHKHVQIPSTIHQRVWRHSTTTDPLPKYIMEADNSVALLREALARMRSTTLKFTANRNAGKILVRPFQTLLFRARKTCLRDAALAVAE